VLNSGFRSHRRVAGLTPGSLPYALRVALRAFALVPDKGVKTGAFSRSATPPKTGGIYAGVRHHFQTTGGTVRKTLQRREEYPYHKGNSSNSRVCSPY
jgi:hypothetical protein